MVATRNGNRDAMAELNRRSQACEVLAGTGIRVAKKAKLVEHEGIAPSTPVWKTGMFLSTLMLEWKLESRVGVAPTWTALQAVA